MHVLILASGQYLYPKESFTRVSRQSVLSSKPYEHRCISVKSEEHVNLKVSNIDFFIS